MKILKLVSMNSQIGLVSIALFLLACMAFGAVSTPRQGQPADVRAAEKGDDWFEEIDDMIQELAVPAPDPQSADSQPPVRLGTNPPPNQSAIGRPDAKRFDNRTEPVEPGSPEMAQISTRVNSEPALSETAASQSAPGPASKSIIEDILRSDYWLEEDMKPKIKSTPAPPSPMASAEQPEPIQEPAAEVVPTPPPPAEPVAASEVPPPAKGAEFEVDLMGDLVGGMEDSLAKPGKPAPDLPPAVTNADVLEKEMLADLNAFMAENQTSAPPATPDTPSMPSEPPPPTQEAEVVNASPQIEAAAVDQTLDRIEAQVEPAAPADTQIDDYIARIEHIHQQIDEAIQSGNRDELSRLTQQLNQAVMGVEQEPSQAEKDVAAIQPQPPVQEPAVAETDTLEVEETTPPIVVMPPPRDDENNQAVRRVVLVETRQSEEAPSRRFSLQDKYNSTQEPARRLPPKSEATIGTIGASSSPLPSAFTSTLPDESRARQPELPGQATGTRRVGVAIPTEPPASEWGSPVPY